tara:strand:+ start:32250 stop:32558 length:309 start_codon:yes stop_codon:yes gene_type:complete
MSQYLIILALGAIGATVYYSGNKQLSSNNSISDNSTMNNRNEMLNEIKNLSKNQQKADAGLHYQNNTVNNYPRGVGGKKKRKTKKRKTKQQKQKLKKQTKKH